MKFRIVKDGNNEYRIQFKSSIFEYWGDDYTTYKNQEEAIKEMTRRIDGIKIEKNKYKITVIRTEKV